ncbi:MAG: DUF1292 domain-containing protein [Lachnospiraceae bacterium]|nr:DUF1292 domain-containing protein [Lachnospiraceae bacterium]
MNENHLITFALEDNTKVQLEVLEETKINGNNYLLAVDYEDDTALILKEMQANGDEVTYAIVEDEQELDAISKVFSELLDDVEFER